MPPHMAFQDTLKRFKPAYTFYNWLHRDQLSHVKAAYAKYGIDKAAYAPVDSRAFAGLQGETPWLDAEDSATLLPQDPRFQSLDAETQAALLPWSSQGYAILRGFFSPDQVAGVRAEVDRLIREGDAKWRYASRVMFALHQSRLIWQLASEAPLMPVLELLMGKPMRAFQSINFLEPSQQATHSDAIHMTTFPLGYLLAAWVALEPTDDQNGPLHYFPGSHRLPYVLNGDYAHGGNRLLLGDDANGAYEKRIAALMEEHKLQKQIFHAQPGDVLIWHANLLHGGEPRLDPNRTRHSMVLHYFADEVVAYHEQSQRPALFVEPKFDQ
ncbi:MAG: phytanoyl-CoA dioxygenase family protein [Bacteroidota bacterium]